MEIHADIHVMIINIDLYPIILVLINVMKVFILFIKKMMRKNVECVKISIKINHINLSMEQIVIVLYLREQ